MIYNKYIEIIFIFFYFVKNISYFLINNDKYLLIKNLCNDISKINIVYIKIFQSISINSTFFDKKTQNYLIQYTDKVPFNNDEIDYESLKYLKQYIEISDYPVNSGIFALVYKGKYNNHDVAIKILKVNIKNKLINCIDNLEILFYICNFIPKIKQFNLYNLLIQNKINLINQTCFFNESNNLKNFKKSIEDNKNIIIPDIFDTFTSSNIIVMNFIKGKKFSELKKEEYDKYGKLLLTLMFCKNGITNYMHSDLHIGNILFLENKLCILDFGLVMKINDEYLSLYFDLLYCSIIDEDYDFIYNNINLFLSEKLNLNILSQEERNLIKNSFYKNTKYVFENEIDLIYLFNEIDKIIKIYNVSININISEAIFSYTFILNTLNELLEKSSMEVFKYEFKKFFNNFELDY